MNFWASKGFNGWVQLALKEDKLVSKMWPELLFLKLSIISFNSTLFKSSPRIYFEFDSKFLQLLTIKFRRKSYSKFIIVGRWNKACMIKFPCWKFYFNLSNFCEKNSFFFFWFSRFLSTSGEIYNLSLEDALQWVY